MKYLYFLVFATLVLLIGALNVEADKLELMLKEVEKEVEEK